MAVNKCVAQKTSEGICKEETLSSTNSDYSWGLKTTALDQSSLYFKKAKKHWREQEKLYGRGGSKQIYDMKRQILKIIFQSQCSRFNDIISYR